MAHVFTSRVRIAPDVLYRLVAEEAVLLNLKTEQYLGLDAVGTRMWEILVAAPSIEAACDTLIGEYDVDPPRLRQDVEEFLDKLLGQRLILVEPSS
jgi:hypothetical protein